jgi:AraC-like DNA-binding protein
MAKKVNDGDKNLLGLDPEKVEVNSQDKKFFEEFKALIEKNISDPELDIDYICKKLYISRSTLFRKIKAITGEKTPNEYIQTYRLQRGAQLLRENFGNVTEVAEAVGFPYPNRYTYFLKIFKKRFGQKPKAYQLEKLKEYIDKPKEKKTKLSFQLDFSIDELDQEIISRIAIKKSEQQFNIDDKTGTIKKNEIINRIEKLYDSDSSLIANKNLAHFTFQELLQKMRQAIEGINVDIFRGRGHSNKRLDYFEISDDRVRHNVLSAATICMKGDLLADGDGYFALRTGIYGSTFNLGEAEAFYHQPVGVGEMCTGVLVGDDVVVTAAHFVNEQNVSGLRFLFDFVMQDPITPEEKIPAANIYKGVAIIERFHNPDADWAAIKLDRKVTGREKAVVSRRNLFFEQPLYVIGNPCGLPLKFSTGAFVDEISDSYFRTGLDVYGGSSGAPVFCAETHELVGLVSRFTPTDFRWTGEKWITLSYPKTDPEFRGARCTRASQFGDHIEK